jgi:hypothetical protein
MIADAESAQGAGRSPHIDATFQKIIDTLCVIAVLVGDQCIRRDPIVA